MTDVRVAEVTYQADDMRAPATGLGVRWRHGWLVAFPEGTYEVVHDRSVLAFVEKRVGPRSLPSARHEAHPATMIGRP